MSTSTSTIQELANKEYKYGFVTDIEPEYPSRPQRRRRSDDFREEERTRVHAGVAAEGIPALAEDGGTRVGQCSLPANRLSRHCLLFGAKAEEGRTQESG